MSPSVSNSAKLFVLEMSQSCDLFSKENAAPAKRGGGGVHAAGCSCGEGACLHLCWLAWFAALKQTSSLGIGALRNVSGAQRVRGGLTWRAMEQYPLSLINYPPNLDLG